jgi:hypothetical protein
MNTTDQIEQSRQELILEEITSFPLDFQQIRNVAKQVWIDQTADLSKMAILASAQKAYNRIEICNTCDAYRDNRCTKCGFFMQRRVHTDSAQCPINKWGPDLQIMLTENEMKASYNITAPINEPVHPMQSVNLNTYPENEKIELIALAQESADRYDGRFTYKGVQYRAILSGGKLNIYFIAPKKQNRTITDHLNAQEKAELMILAKTKLTEANNSRTQFNYKNVNFIVQPMENGGMQLKLAPGEVIPYNNV